LTLSYILVQQSRAKADPEKK